MTRHLLTLGLLLFAGSVAVADPPSDARVLASTKVPNAASDVCIIKNREKNGFIVPVPGLGFLPVPLSLWECTSFHFPPNAPAGARQLRRTVYLFALAE
jgi:hypothetical protein